jgi:tRNA(Ile)-lysidine synthase
VIATGHTIDDQAETVLMRMITGASLVGMTGIPPVRYDGDIRIVRPLIRASKEEILHYLGKTDWKYVEDRTNRELKYLRNRVRIEVIPFLEKYNPKLKRSLANLSDTIREDLLLLEAEKGKALGRYAKGEKGPLSVKIKDMILQPKALRKEMFKELFKRAGGNIKKLTYRHWMDMDYFLRAAEKSKSLDFPGGIRVTKRADEIVFKKR